MECGIFLHPFCVASFVAINFQYLGVYLELFRVLLLAETSLTFPAVVNYGMIVL